MQKQKNKQRSRTYMLNKIFDKHSTVFNVFADTAANFIKLFHCLELKLYIYTFDCFLVCFCCFFLLVCLLACLIVCLFVCVVIMLLLLLCHVSLFLCIFFDLCSYELAFCTIILL